MRKVLDLIIEEIVNKATRGFDDKKKEMNKNIEDMYKQADEIRSRMSKLGTSRG